MSSAQSNAARAGYYAGDSRTDRPPFPQLIEQWRLANEREVRGAKNPEDDTKEDSQARRMSIIARMRPLLKFDEPALARGDFETATVSACQDTVILHACGTEVDGITPSVKHKKFQLHSVLPPSAKESDVFKMSVAPLLPSVLKGAHCTVLCYGQTGSGKTHTIEQLAHQSVHALYRFTNDRTSLSYRAMELSGSAGSSLMSQSKPAVRILQTAAGDVVATPLDPTPADGPAHCLSLFDSASALRAAAATSRNASSSRSHAFHWFHLDQRVGGGCLLLVDLAGSETTKDSLFHDKSRTESTAKVNTSLMALKECMRQFADGASFVNFRADKLTHFLRPCFANPRQPSSKPRASKRPSSVSKAASKTTPTSQRRSAPSLTCFIACFSPLASDHKHSIRTLTYAAQLVRSEQASTQGAQQQGPKSWDKARTQVWLEQFRPGVSRSFQGVTGSSLCHMTKEEMARRIGNAELGALLYDELYRLRSAKKK